MINRERVVATFMELCSIDSEPLQERLLADRMIDLLTGLGFTVTEDDAGIKTGGNAGNLYARLEGTAPGDTLLFSSHLDRVVPGVGVKPRIEKGFVVSDGTTVLGADDASGLAAILEGVATVREQGIAHPAIELVLTVAEELALVGSSHFDISQVTSRIGFLLDAGGPVGEIVIQAPEQIKYTATFHGRSAHAGFNPEEGVSAIQMAAAAISRLKLLRIDMETTANIGSISASGPTNIVPDRCELEGEVRSLDPEKAMAEVASVITLLDTVASEYGGRVDIKVRHCYPAYRLTEEAEPARRAASAGHRLGLPVRFKSTGGGSDGNIFNSRGVPSVVLSCGYEKVHTIEERISVEQLERLAEWVVAIIADGTVAV